MKKPWFGERKWGYGWGLPITWQGWVVFSAYLLVVLIMSLFFSPHTSSQTSLFITVLILASILLVLICYKTSGKPQWRWGNKK